MNREETQRAIEVMRAWCDGKEIQLAPRHNPDAFLDMDGPDVIPSWDWQRYIYRVKPEPRRWWVIVNDNDAAMNIFKDKPVATFTGFEIVEVVEVLP